MFNIIRIWKKKGGGLYYVENGDIYKNFGTDTILHKINICKEIFDSIVIFTRKVESIEKN